MSENEIPKKIRPSRKWYMLSLALLLIGPFISLYLLYATFSSAIHSITFFAPGKSQIYIAEAGDYTLWVSSNIPGGSEKIVADLQGIPFTFTDAAQKSFTVVPKKDWSDIANFTAHDSLGVVRFPHAGNYQVNAASRSFYPHKIMLRQPSLLKIMKALAYSVILTLFSLISGALSAIIILIQRINSRNTMQTPEQKPLPNNTEKPSDRATSWAMLCHLSGFAGFIFPLANIIAPLAIWGFKHKEFPYLDEQGREAINFQISITIYYLVSALLILIIIGLFLLPILAAFQIVAMIIASIESAQGKPFRYPLTIRFLK